jgi:hypothetical protein
MEAVLSTAYFGNIQYFSKYILYKNIIIDIHETYPRQTYRNRCEILTANGKLSLSIPIVKPGKSLTKNVKIDNTYAWQKQHYRAILSAYKNSPFFDFFIDEFYFVFDKHYNYLIDLNSDILIKCLNILEINSNWSYSDDFIRSHENNFREKINPKNKEIIDLDFMPKNYMQVFGDRFDFFPNLSILDLIFNEGKNSIVILKKSIIKKDVL